MSAEVSLEQRQHDYDQALAVAEEWAAREFDARIQGTLTLDVRRRTDEAQRELRSAKRRLEQTQRRLAKRKEQV